MAIRFRSANGELGLRVERLASLAVSGDSQRLIRRRTLRCRRLLRRMVWRFDWENRSRVLFRRRDCVLLRRRLNLRRLHYRLWLGLLSRLRRLRVRRLSGACDLVVDAVFRFIEFLDRLSHSFGEIGQFFRAKKQQHDQQNNDEVGTSETCERCERDVHTD